MKKPKTTKHRPLNFDKAGLDLRLAIIDNIYSLHTHQWLLKVIKEDLAKTKSAKKQKEYQEDIKEIKRIIRERKKSIDALFQQLAKAAS